MSSTFGSDDTASSSGGSSTFGSGGGSSKKKGKSSPVKGAGNFLKSFVNDIKETVPRVPAGLLGLGEGLVNLPQFALGAAEGKRGDELAKYAPQSSNLFKGTAQILRNSGATLLPISKSSKDAIGQYSEAPLKNLGSHPFNFLAGEAALAAPVLGKLAGAAVPAAEGASLTERLASMTPLQKAAWAAKGVAEGPIAPYKAAFKIPGVLGKLGEASLADEAAGAGRSFPGAKTLAGLSDASQALKSEAGKVKAYLNEGRVAPDRLTAKIKEILPSTDEQMAATAVRNGEAGQLSKLRAENPAHFESRVVEGYGPVITPTAASIAADIADGVAAPEVAARIQAANDVYESAPQNQKATPAGFDGKKVPTQAVQGSLLGEGDTLPVQDVVQPTFDRFKSEPKPVEKPLPETNVEPMPQAGVSWRGEQQSLFDTTDESLFGNKDRFDPEAGKTIFPERKVGPHLHEVLQSLRLARSKSPAPIINALEDADLPMAAKQLKEAVHDWSAEGVAKTASKENAVRARSDSYGRIIESPFAARLGEGALQGVNTLEEARAAGYSPIRDTSNSGALRSRVADANTVFLPTPAVEAFDNMFKYTKGSDLARVLGKGNRAFYATRLALNPAFITGRVFGHAMLGVAQTSNPLELGKNIFKVVGDWKESGGSFKDLVKSGEDNGHFPGGPQLHASGATEAERARMVSDSERPGRLARSGLGEADNAAGKAIRAGDSVRKARGKVLTQATKRQYAVASFMDNVQRSAFFLTELGKAGSEEAALTSTLRALGDFNRLTPFEQNSVRQIIPMYAWHKELTRIAFHLAEDHPLRVAWTLQLANSLGKPDSPLSEYNQASIGVGNKLIGTGLLNPFSEVTGSLGGGLKGIGKLLGPGPRLAANFLTGENTSTGKDWFRPPGTGTSNGRPAAPSLLRQLRPMIPQFRLLDSLTGANKTPQYASGEKFIPGDSSASTFGVKGATTKSSLLESISGFLGLPLTNKTEAEQEEQAALARALKKLTAQQKQQLNFLLKQQGGQ